MKLVYSGTPNCSVGSIHRHEFPCVDLHQRLTWHQILLTTIYCILLVFGLPLNFYVIWIVTTIVRLGKDTSSRHLHLFILSLSIVDSMVIVCIPFIMSDVILMEYALGATLCRIQFTSDIFHKIFSSFILTGLSWDRLSAVRHPMGRGSSFNMRWAKMFLSVSLLVACAATIPILLYTDTVDEHYVTSMMHPGMLLNVTVTKCYFTPPDHLANPFPITIFFLGFACPIIVITTCYSLAMYLLRRHIKNQSSSAISLKKVSKSVGIVVSFYYACWAPYWFVEVMLNLISPESLPPMPVHLSLFIHCLPLMNSAINPVLYALLNRELRRTYTTATETRRESRSFYNMVSTSSKRNLNFEVIQNKGSTRASATSLVRPNLDDINGSVDLLDSSFMSDNAIGV